MKFIKPVSMICLISVCGYANAVNITPQIQRLLDEKQEKIAALEKCEGKKKGFMIAGISTIGLTAVGVAGNIILANKSDKLSDELESKSSQLSQKQDELSKLNADIEKDRRNKKIADCTRKNKDYDPTIDDCKEVVYVPAQVETTLIPVLDGPFDGVIGQKCGEADLGVWTVTDTSDKDCMDDATKQIVRCVCAKEKGENIKNNKSVKAESIKPLESKLDKTDKGHLNTLNVVEVNVVKKSGGDDINNIRSAAYCFKHMRDYLLRECPKCISNGIPGGSGFWDFEGQSICENIANNGGLYNISWDGNTDTATLFKLYARENGFNTRIWCPIECGKM